MTHKDLQAILKEYRSLGYELEVKLNATTEALQTELDRLQSNLHICELTSAVRLPLVLPEVETPCSLPVEYVQERKIADTYWQSWHDRYERAMQTLKTSEEQQEIETGENEITVLIASECEKYEFEILDDGVYYNERKLGEVGRTSLDWWVVRESSTSKTKIPCDSAPDAVWSLWAMETSASIDEMDYEELLDIPFEMLTNIQWNLIKGYKPVSEVEEFVAA
jgi:hypothetical protein